MAATAAAATATIRYTVSDASIGTGVLSASIVAVSMDVLSDCPRNLIKPRNDDADASASLGILRIICVVFGEARKAKLTPRMINEATKRLDHLYPASDVPMPSAMKLFKLAPLNGSSRSLRDLHGFLKSPPLP
jgi:hypothetical protein